jgi:hypothetical protein
MKTSNCINFTQSYATNYLPQQRTAIYPKSRANIPRFVMSYFLHGTGIPQSVRWLPYGLLVRQNIIRWLAGAKDFSPVPSGRTDSGAHPTPIQRVLEVLSTGAQRQGREVNHSPPPSAEVKNEWSCTSTLHIYLHGVDKHKFKRNFKSLKKT